MAEALHRRRPVAPADVAGDRPPSAVLQRYPDLAEVYRDREPPNKGAWLARFGAVQQLLCDRGKVDQALRGLAALMEGKRLTLAAALRFFAWPDPPPATWVLVDFVPASVFLDLLRRRVPFTDLVGLRHGVESHGIQWFIVRFHLGVEEADALYAEAGNPRWIRGSKSMWDYVVDVTGLTDTSDFTQPDHLEAYLIDRRNPIAATGLGKELRAIHAAQPARKTDLARRYPPEGALTDRLRQAIAAHRALAAQRPNAEDRRAIDLEMMAVTEAVATEEVTTTTTVDGVTQTITWTGWISTASSQRKDAPTYLTPTVAKIAA